MESATTTATATATATSITRPLKQQTDGGSPEKFVDEDLQLLKKKQKEKKKRKVQRRASGGSTTSARRRPPRRSHSKRLLQGMLDSVVSEGSESIHNENNNNNDDDDDDDDDVEMQRRQSDGLFVVKKHHQRTDAGNKSVLFESEGDAAAGGNISTDSSFSLQRYLEFTSENMRRARFMLKQQQQQQQQATAAGERSSSSSGYYGRSASPGYLTGSTSRSSKQRGTLASVVSSRSSWTYRSAGTGDSVFSYDDNNYYKGDKDNDTPTAASYIVDGIKTWLQLPTQSQKQKQQQQRQQQQQRGPDRGIESKQPSKRDLISSDTNNDSHHRHHRRHHHHGEEDGEDGGNKENEQLLHRRKEVLTLRTPKKRRGPDDDDLPQRSAPTSSKHLSTPSSSAKQESFTEAILNYSLEIFQDELIDGDDGKDINRILRFGGAESQSSISDVHSLTSTVFTPRYLPSHSNTTTTTTSSKAKQDEKQQTHEPTQEQPEADVDIEAEKDEAKAEAGVQQKKPEEFDDEPISSKQQQQQQQHPEHQEEQETTMDSVIVTDTDTDDAQDRMSVLGDFGTQDDLMSMSLASDGLTSDSASFSRTAPKSVQRMPSTTSESSSTANNTATGTKSATTINVSRDLIIKYYLHTGAERDVAETLAGKFFEQQQQDLQNPLHTPPPPIRVAHEPMRTPAPPDMSFQHELTSDSSVAHMRKTSKRTKRQKKKRSLMTVTDSEEEGGGGRGGRCFDKNKNNTKGSVTTSEDSRKRGSSSGSGSGGGGEERTSAGTTSRSAVGGRHNHAQARTGVIHSPPPTRRNRARSPRNLRAACAAPSSSSRSSRHSGPQTFSGGAVDPRYLTPPRPITIQHPQTQQSQQQQSNVDSTISGLTMTPVATPVSQGLPYNPNRPPPTPTRKASANVEVLSHDSRMHSYESTGRDKDKNNSGGVNFPRHHQHGHGGQLVAPQLAPRIMHVHPPPRRKPTSDMIPIHCDDLDSSAQKRKATPWWVGFWIVVVVVIAASITTIVLFGPAHQRQARYQGPPTPSPTNINDDVVRAAIEISGSRLVTKEGTSQRQAVGWLSTQDEIDPEGYGDRFLQRYVMLVFYYSTGGPSWPHQGDWLKPDVHECNWSTGIFCNEDKDTGHRIVSAIDFTSNGLRGTVPQELGLLEALEFIKLGNNDLGGWLPGSIFELPKLALFDGKSNSFVGFLPTNHTVSLSFLDLSDNSFTGFIPESLYDCFDLRFLNLAENQLNGSIGRNVGKLTLLQRLYLYGNEFTGFIPPTLSASSELATVDLSQNALTGAIPTEVGSLHRLEDLNLSTNQLMGTIPSEIGNLNELLTLELADNKLTGTIPTLLANLGKLESLSLEGNSLVGNIPQGLCGLGNGDLISAATVGCDVECGCCEDTRLICLEGTNN